MTFKQFGEKYFLRFNYQEDFVEELLKFCTSEGVTLANLEGIGSFVNCEVAFFDVVSKKFKSKIFDSTHEVLSLLGTITEKDGQPYLHAHVTVSDDNFGVSGGHLNKARVGGTLEIVLEKVTGSVERKFDDSIGLNLMQF